MRNLVMGMLVVGLMAVPSLGVINVSVTADKTTLAYGESTYVRVFAQATAAGLYSLAGDVLATGDAGVLVTVPPIFFDALFNPAAPFAPTAGVPGANGGWTGFGTMQTGWAAPTPLWVGGLGQVCYYLVTADSVTGSVTLSFNNRKIGGYKSTEVDKTSVMGTLTSVTITVPEPMTMALLALGGLVVARRRR